jgi:hypothetical protein
MAAASICSSAYLAHGPRRFFLLFPAQRRIGEQQRGVETAEEKSLGEAKRLRAGEKKFLGLLTLLINLRGGKSHDCLGTKRMNRRRDRDSGLFYRGSLRPQ